MPCWLNSQLLTTSSSLQQTAMQRQLRISSNGQEVCGQKYLMLFLVLGDPLKSIAQNAEELKIIIE